jgi:hypothetical protein
MRTWATAPEVICFVNLAAKPRGPHPRLAVFARALIDEGDAPASGVNTVTGTARATARGVHGVSPVWTDPTHFSSDGGGRGDAPA